MRKGLSEVEPHRSAILLVVASVMLGLLSAGTALARLRRLEAQLGEEVPVVVAGAPIPAGEVIAPSALRVVGVARRYVFASSFQDPARVAGSVARVPLQPGEPVLASMLAPADGLAADQRVYTLAAGERVVVEPDIVPGDRVDVLGVYERGDRRLAEVLLQGAQVVRVQGAEGGEGTPAAGGGPPSGWVRIALRVSLEDTRVLAWVENFGQQIRVVRQPAVVAPGPNRPRPAPSVRWEEEEPRVH